MIAEHLKIGMKIVVKAVGNLSAKIESVFSHLILILFGDIEKPEKISRQPGCFQAVLRDNSPPQPGMMFGRQSFNEMNHLWQKTNMVSNGYPVQRFALRLDAAHPITFEGQGSTVRCL